MPKRKSSKKIIPKETPVEAEGKNNYWGIGGFILIILLVAGAFFYIGTDKPAEDETNLDNSSIVVNNIRFLFRHNISDFTKVEVFPNDLHIGFAVAPDLDYYKIDFSTNCEEKGLCSPIYLGKLDITNAIDYSYSVQTGNTNRIVSNSTVFLNDNALVESNLSKLRGLEIILMTPGETNRTKISSYEIGQTQVVVIEGNDTDNFLMAVDMFNYLTFLRLNIR